MRRPKKEQRLVINPETTYPANKVKMCVKCHEGCVERVATRLVPVNAGVRYLSGIHASSEKKRVIPMCTRHASAAWRPSPSMAAITVSGEVDLEEEGAR